jgi:hypothetical protein
MFRFPMMRGENGETSEFTRTERKLREFSVCKTHNAYQIYVAVLPNYSVTHSQCLPDTRDSITLLFSYPQQMLTRHHVTVLVKCAVTHSQCLPDIHDGISKLYSYS